MFLTGKELELLTGRKQKSQQIIQLRKMGVAFFVNACGQPIVTVAAVEGRKAAEPKQDKSWSPKWAENLA